MGARGYTHAHWSRRTRFTQSPKLSCDHLYNSSKQWSSFTTNSTMSSSDSTEGGSRTAESGTALSADDIHKIASEVVSILKASTPGPSPLALSSSNPPTGGGIEGTLGLTVGWLNWYVNVSTYPGLGPRRHVLHWFLVP